MSTLFSPLTLRGITIRNRIGVSPMCQYSSEDGLANDWHLVHYGSRALGGAGLVLMEAAAVSPEGRISARDLGFWSDAHAESLQSTVRMMNEKGATSGIQLAHAGPKASRFAPWLGGGDLGAQGGGWQVIGPGPQAFGEGYQSPQEMSLAQIHAVTADFVAAAQRALAIGIQVIELHAAHGYLLNSFLSPLTNHRTDLYGGSFAHRIRFLLETVRAVRKVWPEHLPLFVRLSVSDWVEGGWTLEDSLSLSELLGAEGVDVIDCSSGGNSPLAKIPVGANYQVPFAAAIRQKTGLKTAAVGLITEAQQAEAIVRTQQADLVLLGRVLLRDPYWPLHAAQKLGVPLKGLVPPQYERGF